jgi:hypothetical protein
MITNLNTQVQMISILDDADLEAVSGGNVHDAAVRAALGGLFNNAYAGYLTGEVYRENPCPLSR